MPYHHIRAGFEIRHGHGFSSISLRRLPHTVRPNFPQEFLHGRCIGLSHHVTRQLQGNNRGERRTLSSPDKQQMYRLELAADRQPGVHTSRSFFMRAEQSRTAPPIVCCRRQEKGNFTMMIRLKLAAVGGASSRKPSVIPSSRTDIARQGVLSTDLGTERTSNSFLHSPSG